jgi:L-rhamnose mutarotase
MSAQTGAIRKAFVMSVNAGQEAEYERRHQPIWPELEAVLRKHGVVTYSIFLLPDTRQLFGYVEFEDQAQWDAVAGTAICQKWWAYMKDIMPSHGDNSPISTELKDVFHIQK